MERVAYAHSDSLHALSPMSKSTLNDVKVLDTSTLLNEVSAIVADVAIFVW